MYLEIELPVYCFTKEQETLMEMGHEIPSNEIEIKEMTFYSIDNLQPLGENTSLVSSGSEDFTVGMPYDYLKGKIKESKIPNFN